MPAAPALHPDSIVQIASSVAASPLDGETAILHLTSGIYYGLDGVGTRVWELLQRPLSVAEIRDAIVAEYDVTAESCEADVIALLRELVGEGLVDIQTVGHDEEADGGAAQAVKTAL